MAIDNIARGLANNVGLDALDTSNAPIDGYFLSNDSGILEWKPITGGLDFKGSWNADTNTPTLVSGVGTAGDFYIVSVAGNTNLDGETNWNVDDQAMFNGTIWQRIPATSVDNTPIELTGSNVVLQTNTVYLINATASDATITIPDADATNGGRYIQIIKNSGDFHVIVVTTSGQIIGTLTEQTIYKTGKGFTTISRGADTEWAITQDSRTAVNINAVNSTYTVNDEDNVILADGTFTITLPTTLFTGFRVAIKNIGIGTVTLSSPANIDDSTTKTMNIQYDSYTLQWDGTQWWLL